MQIQEVGRLSQASGFSLAGRASLIAVALTVLAAVLRVLNIDANGMSLDEAYTLWMARNAPLEIVRMIIARGGDANPPLFYMLTHGALQLSHDLLGLRAVSILAGCGLVWLTFHWGLYAFDLRVASLAGLLAALAPLLLEGARIARAPMLAAFWSVLSLYMVTRILWGDAAEPLTGGDAAKSPRGVNLPWGGDAAKSPGGVNLPLGGDARRRHWLTFILASALALYTHYLTFLVLVFECGVIAVMLFSRRGPGTWRRLGHWLAAWTAVAILVLPLVKPILSRAGVNGGQEWLGRPGISALVKSAIFYVTGDPSYGFIRVTPERALAVAVVALVFGLIAWVILRRRAHGVSAAEAHRALYLAAAFLVPWLMAWGISQVRPIFHQKYFLFVMPPLFIVAAWALTRARPVLMARLTLIALLLVTVRSVLVFHTEPTDEQWREGVAYVAADYRPDDVVIVSPGYNLRPFAYYFQGEFPADVTRFSPLPAVLLHAGQYSPLPVQVDGQSARSDDPRLRSAARIWLVTGEIPDNQPVESMLVDWLQQTFDQRASADFVGVRVRLLQAGVAQR